MKTPRSCEVCEYMHRMLVLSVALWATWDRTGAASTALCQEHLDEAFDEADRGDRLEPLRVEWLDGSRTLVAA